MNYLNEANKITPKTLNKNYLLGMWLGRDEIKVANCDIAHYNSDHTQNRCNRIALARQSRQHHVAHLLSTCPRGDKIKVAGHNITQYNNVRLCSK
jgi:hypothetical protein